MPKMTTGRGEAPLAPPSVIVEDGEDGVPPNTPHAGHGSSGCSLAEYCAEPNIACICAVLWYRVQIWRVPYYACITRGWLQANTSSIVAFEPRSVNGGSKQSQDCQG